MDIESDIHKLTSFLSELNELRSSDSQCANTTLPSSDTSFKISSDTISAPSIDSEKIKKCLENNINCIAVLNYFESLLQNLLAKCIREQRVVKAQIEVSSKLKNKGFPTTKRIEAHIKRVCQTPYFKDPDGFSHCCNEDTVKRGRFGFLNICDMRKPMSWNTQEEEIVKNFVREEEKKKWIQTLKRCGMLHMTNVEEMSLADLVESRIVEYDWLKLSVSELKNVHSPHECRAVWMNCLHPVINQTQWSEKENNELKELVSLYNKQDWEKVALDLQTKRSTFQCIIQYSGQLEEAERGTWSDNEIELLKKTVSKLCFMNYIPWNKVRSFVDGRTLKEIVLEWTKINSLGKPRTFSLEEDIVLVAGMRVFGDDISQMSQCLPDRSTRQIRERINVLMGRQFPRKRWSESEDKLLCELVEKYGFGNWLKISLHLVNRDPSSVRKRFITLRENAIKYGSTASCSSKTVCSPKTKLDIVNIEMLWETAKNICSEYGLSSSLNDSFSSKPRVDIVQKLSTLLKPTMRNRKMIESSKMKPILENEYLRFFFPTYMLSMDKCQMSSLDEGLILNEVYDLVNILRLLKAELEFPQMYLGENDSTFSDDDKSILKYIFNKKSKLLRQDKNNSPFCLTRQKNFSSLVCDSASEVDSSYIVPLNSANLLALRTLCLHHQNLKCQKEGLTLQVDDTELKYARNSVCTPQNPRFDKDCSIACEFWNKRLFQILCCPYLFLNDTVKCSEIFG